MVKTLLVRGMLAGVVAGLLAFGFARVFGEPPIDKAIAFEEQMEKAQHATVEHSHPQPSSQSGQSQATAAATAPVEEELVSRSVQANLGLFVAVVVYGSAMGGLFGLVFAFAYGRMGHLGPRTTAALLAIGGFISVVMVPFLKYPASPPATSSADTVGIRTALFLIAIAISIAALTLAAGLVRRLMARFGAWNGGIVSAAIFVAIIAVAYFALPDINEVPAEFPADVLWHFRVAALGMQVVIWTTLGLLFGAFATRVVDTRGVSTP